MPDLCSTFGKKIISCHVMSALTYPTKSERARIEQSARGSNRVPADRTERPQTECHRIRQYPILVYVEILENVHNTLSTAAHQLNTKKYENEQYVVIFILFFYFFSIF